MKSFGGSIGQNKFVIDASDYGNLGRFFNHQCGAAGEDDGPNMFQQTVYSDIQDIRQPYLAFFAARDIYKGEELTWNYGYRKMLRIIQISFKL